MSEEWIVLISELKVYQCGCLYSGWLLDMFKREGKRAVALFSPIGLVEEVCNARVDFFWLQGMARGGRDFAASSEPRKISWDENPKVGCFRTCFYSLFLNIISYRYHIYITRWRNGNFSFFFHSWEVRVWIGLV